MKLWLCCIICACLQQQHIAEGNCSITCDCLRQQHIAGSLQVLTNLPRGSDCVVPQAHTVLWTPHAALQRCICYSGHIANGPNGSVYCAPDLVDSHRKISIVLLVVVPVLVVLFIVLNALGRLHRGSYDVLRWVKPKGAPGHTPSKPLCHHLLTSVERLPCFLATYIASRYLSTRLGCF